MLDTDRAAHLTDSCLKLSCPSSIASRAPPTMSGA